MIDREIENVKNGSEGLIRAKFNALIDDRIVQKLYEASQAGVKIELIVRGMCSLIPGIPGVSENIEVHSIVGEFLEHSRIYYFSSITAQKSCTWPAPTGCREISTDASKRCFRWKIRTSKKSARYSGYRLA